MKKKFEPHIEGENKLYKGDSFGYGRKKSKEKTKMVEYMDKLRATKPDPLEIVSTILSSDAPRSKKVKIPTNNMSDTEIRKAKIKWNREHRKNKKRIKKK